MRTLPNVLAPMDDGVGIAANIFLPDRDGRYPAVLYFGPYRKEDWILNGSLRGLPQRYTERGYAFIIADVRGTNTSGGIAAEMFSAREQKDGGLLVEWIAAQGWCDGNVGMTGLSYGFFTSLQTAMQHPPHLRTVVPIHGGVSWFYCVNEGGLPMAFGYHANNGALMIAMQAGPPGTRAEGWRGRWRERMETFVPWYIDSFAGLADAAAYDTQSINRHYDRIQVPVFAIGGWWDRYPSDAMHLQQNVKVPVKVLIGPWQHARPDIASPGPRLDYEIVLRWFDHWLKGEPNGILEEPLTLYFAQRYSPPVGYKAAIPGEWRQSAAVTWRTFPFGEGAFRYRYDPTVGACSGLSGGIYGPVGMPLDQRPDEAKSVLWTSPPVTEEFEVTGIPRVRLNFSSTARVMGVVVKLCDVAPDGTSALITRGYLNVCHRDGLDRPAELKPDEVYALAVELKATSYIFEPGHSIRIAITSAEFPSLFPTREPGTNTVLFHGSRLELPVTRGTPVAMKELPNPPVEPPKGLSFRVDQDAATGECRALLDVDSTFASRECTVRYRHRTAARVHPDRPEAAVVESDCRFTFGDPSGGSIETQSSVSCRGDASQIRVTASLRVLEDGKECFTRNWEKSHPRKFI